jgi:Lrp/AsnC family transcriptional regulator for asnA, asnC and gidA
MNSQAIRHLDKPQLETPNLEELETLDLRILGLLQQDSRLSFNKIASKLGISVGTAFNHVKNLEKKGVLKGYTILLDSNRVGYSLTTLIMVQVEGGHLLDVEDEVSKAPNVVAVYDITGDYDAAVIAKFKDRECLNSFIKNLMAIPHVKRTVTSVVLDVVKEDLQVSLQKAEKQTESIC